MYFFKQLNKHNKFRHLKKPIKYLKRKLKEYWDLMQSVV